MGPLQTARAIHEIGNRARQVFIGREDLIQAIELAFISGQHAIVLGPPGTAKSAIICRFAEAAGLRFFRRVLNPDTPREDLVGPIDPLALQRGEWDRKWAGLATCHVAFLDEIGKASSQVVNMLLDAMEERRVTSGDIDKPIPLHIVISASNETIDRDSAAIWDRFTIRLVVRYLNNAGDFATLLADAWGADSVEKTPVAIEDLQECREMCKRMAAEAYESAPVLKAMMTLWRDMGQHRNMPVSDRRWLRTLQVAAASALLSGHDSIAVTDLMSARFVLWGEVNDIDNIAAFIGDVINAENRELQVAEQVVAEMETIALSWMDSGRSPAHPDNLAAASKLLYRIDQMLPSVEQRAKESNNGWDILVSRLNALRDATNS